MTLFNHILGFPRIGINRELKISQENYWSGKIKQSELLLTGKILRKKHWEQQKQAGIDIIPVGDFAWYDHVLSTSMMLGNIPERHKDINNEINIDTLFRIARGSAPTGINAPASEMTKWFNTNYHYIVPELNKKFNFRYSWFQLIDEVDEALLLGYTVKPVLLGPISYLWLGAVKGELFNKLELIDQIIPIYQEVLSELLKRKISWIQIDEPILSLDLSKEWINSFFYTYQKLNIGMKVTLATYFGDIQHNLENILKLPIQGLHVDIISGKYDLNVLNRKIPHDWLLSLGIINGRNIWRADLISLYKKLNNIINDRLNLCISSSCSLLHCPIDVNLESGLDKEVKGWFAFALQKCHELFLLKTALNNQDIHLLDEWVEPLYARKKSKKVHNKEVTNRIESINLDNHSRFNSYDKRALIQKKYLNLPILPTTTIGSFPQTNDLRKIRSDFKNNNISFKEYEKGIKTYIKNVIKKQEELGIDVLVHGEPERNDMVEYFGENLDGFVFTKYGWVQSYGSRCVKPPIIIGDISRSQPITLEWTTYAQSLTNKPVKGMLTGPVTILCWSFPREDISKSTITKQIALALRDEVLDLERLGINIIQIDEPALREGLPLRKIDRIEYLSWATKSFRLSYSGVKDRTQIHTHMCYCEFNDIMDAIVKLDADVITLETSRSDMTLLKFFEEFKYPNEIGPGVYDIHSPNIPTIHWIEKFLKKAMNYISVDRLWVNPDCGLKTRTWKETENALKNMVIATHNIRNWITQ